MKNYLVSGCTHRKHLARMKRWPHPLAPPLLLASGQPVGQERKEEQMSPPHPPQRYAHVTAMLHIIVPCVTVHIA